MLAVGRQKPTASTSTAVVSNRPDRGRLFGRKFGRNLTIFSWNWRKNSAISRKLRKKSNFGRFPVVFSTSRSKSTATDRLRPTVNTKKKPCILSSHMGPIGGYAIKTLLIIWRNTTSSLRWEVILVILTIMSTPWGSASSMQIDVHAKPRTLMNPISERNWNLNAANDIEHDVVVISASTPTNVI